MSVDAGCCQVRQVQQSVGLDMSSKATGIIHGYSMANDFLVESSGIN